MDRLLTNTYRDGFDANLCGVGAKRINFATNLIGFAAPPRGFRSFPCRFERERIGFQPPTVGLGSFLCGIESTPSGMKSFPCGNEPFPHRNDLQQLHEESIEWGDTRFPHVALTRFHMGMTHSYIGMSPSDVVSRRRRFASTFRRFISGLRRFAWSWKWLHDIPILLRAGPMCLGDGPKFLCAGTFSVPVRGSSIQPYLKGSDLTGAIAAQAQAG